MSIHLAHLSPRRVSDAAVWWRTERPEWPLDRALPLERTDHADTWWDPDNPADLALYDQWRAEVLDHARQDSRP